MIERQRWRRDDQKLRVKARSMKVAINIIVGGGPRGTRDAGQKPQAASCNASGYRTAERAWGNPSGEDGMTPLRSPTGKRPREEERGAAQAADRVG